ncbi:hypothetical protein CCMA1212_003825 [Trichoderma ghanense]|uniref:Uncharacterized protein n=1 Tax=Trichoderma ghanense TaxID=65468 RepID=A0ABY2H7Q0_9HYPO
MIVRSTPKVVVRERGVRGVDDGAGACRGGGDVTGRVDAVEDGAEDARGVEGVGGGGAAGGPDGVGGAEGGDALESVVGAG